MKRQARGERGSKVEIGRRKNEMKKGEMEEQGEEGEMEEMKEEKDGGRGEMSGEGRMGVL